MPSKHDPAGGDTADSIPSLPMMPIESVTYVSREPLSGYWGPFARAVMAAPAGQAVRVPLPPNPEGRPVDHVTGPFYKPFRARGLALHLASTMEEGYVWAWCTPRAPSKNGSKPSDPKGQA